MTDKNEADTSIRRSLINKAVELRRPISCYFELTHKCNLRCPMCYIRMTDEQAAAYGQMFPVDMWKNMAKQVRDAGVLSITFTGGECTTYPGFAELYRECYRLGFRVTMISNAVAYDDELHDLFREYPPYHVAVTLYGACNETYRIITGVADGYDRATKNIDFFRSLGVPVVVNFVGIRQNIRDLPAIDQFCRERRIRLAFDTDMSDHNYDPSFSDVEKCRLTTAERVELLFHPLSDVEAALEDAKKLEGLLDNYSFEKGDNSDLEFRPCIGSYSSAAIAWNGKLYTCVSMAGRCKGYEPFKVGFEVAWQQMMKAHDEFFDYAPQCKECALFRKCSRHCAAQNLQGGGDVKIPDPEQCRFEWLRNKRGHMKGADDVNADTMLGDCDIIIETKV